MSFCSNQGENNSFSFSVPVGINTQSKKRSLEICSRSEQTRSQRDDHIIPPQVHDIPPYPDDRSKRLSPFLSPGLRWVLSATRSKNSRRGRKETPSVHEELGWDLPRHLHPLPTLLLDLSSDHKSTWTGTLILTACSLFLFTLSSRVRAEPLRGPPTTRVSGLGG